jgi:hypothetical protein
MTVGAVDDLVAQWQRARWTVREVTANNTYWWAVMTCTR